MRNRDWSLVFFTTLSQLSVGIVLCFTLICLFNGELSLLFEKGLSLKNPVFLALGSVGLATLISFLHLGKPSNAPKALNNLAGSWVSREILALGLYSVSLLIVFVSGWTSWNIEYWTYLLLPGSVFGVALLWMMIRIYMMPTIPAWNSWYTRLSFVSTTLCLGLLTFLLLQKIAYVNLESQLSQWIMVLLIMVLFIETVSGFFHQFRLEKMNTGIDELVFNQGTFYKVFLFRMVILIMAGTMMLIIILNPGLFPEYSHDIWVYPLAALVIAQELMGRLLFYSSYFRLGV